MIRVSVRFNMFGVRVIKQGIVPCKLLIAASEIVVFVGCNITDATPIFCQAHSVVHRVVNSIRRVLESADINFTSAQATAPTILFFYREPTYLLQLCISGIAIRAFIAILKT